MPIDPRVPLGAVASTPTLQVESPMQLMNQFHQMQNMQMQQQYNRERIEIQQQEEARAQAKAAEEARTRAESKEFQDWYGERIAPISLAEREAVLSQIPAQNQFRYRTLLANHDKLMGEAQKAKAEGAEGETKAQTARLAALGQLGQGVAEAGYTPTAFNFAFREAAAKDETGLRDQYNWVMEDFENRVTPFINSVIAAGTPEQEGTVVQPGQQIKSRVSGRLIAEGPPAPERQVNLQQDSFFVQTPGGGRKFVEGSFDPVSGKRFDNLGNDVSQYVVGKPPTEPIDPSTRPMTPNQRVDAARSIRGEWSRAIRPYQERQGQAAKIDAGLTRLDKVEPTEGDKIVAADAIQFTFQKMLDEISVVRETEYARPAEMQSMESRILGYMRQLSEGGSKMSPDNLKTMAGFAKQMAGDLNKISEAYLTDQREAIEESLKGTDISPRSIFGSSILGRRATPAEPGATPKVTIKSITPVP